METVRQQIRQFKEDNAVDKVIILWTANTERYAQVRRMRGCLCSCWVQLLHLCAATAQVQRGWCRSGQRTCPGSRGGAENRDSGACNS